MGAHGKGGARVKGLHTVRTRGKCYVYAYRGGPCIWKGEGAPNLTAPDVARLLKALEAQHNASVNSFGGWLHDWQESPEWARMADSTRREWGHILALIPRKWEALPASFWEDQRARRFIAEWRAQWAATPRKADYVVQVLSALFRWLERNGRFPRGANPAHDIPKLWKGGQHAEVIWTREEVERWQSAPGPIRDAFNLARLTGLRRGDLVKLPRGACGPSAILWKTSKSGRVIRIPYTPALKELIRAILGRNEGVTVLVNSHGRPWQESALNWGFNKARTKLGLPPKRLHDCRGTYVTELRKAGLGAKEIALQMGWGESRVERLLAIYSDETGVVVAMGERMNG
jgi:integrase